MARGAAPLVGDRSEIDRGARSHQLLLAHINAPEHLIRADNAPLGGDYGEYRSTVPRSQKRSIGGDRIASAWEQDLSAIRTSAIRTKDPYGSPDSANSSGAARSSGL